MRVEVASRKDVLNSPLKAEKAPPPLALIRPDPAALLRSCASALQMTQKGKRTGAVVKELSHHLPPCSLMQRAESLLEF